MDHTVKDDAVIATRPAKLIGVTYKQRTPLGTLYLTVNQDTQGEPLEVFLNIGKAGSDIQAMAEAIGRLISLALRMPSSLSRQDRLHQIVYSLIGIGGSRSIGLGPQRICSLPDGVARLLVQYVPTWKVTKEEGAGNVNLLSDHFCPACGNNTLIEGEGGSKCSDCEYSDGGYKETASGQEA